MAKKKPPEAACTLRDLQQGLVRAAPDAELQKAYGDWLADRGQHDLAHAYWWMAKHRRNPARVPGGWYWTFTDPADAKALLLPVHVFLDAPHHAPTLVGVAFFSLFSSSRSRTYAKAVEWLACALRRVREVVDI